MCHRVQHHDGNNQLSICSLLLFFLVKSICSLIRMQNSLVLLHILSEYRWAFYVSKHVVKNGNCHWKEVSYMSQPTRFQIQLVQESKQYIVLSCHLRKGCRNISVSCNGNLHRCWENDVYCMIHIPTVHRTAAKMTLKQALSYLETGSQRYMEPKQECGMPHSQYMK